MSSSCKSTLRATFQLKKQLPLTLQTQEIPSIPAVGYLRTDRCISQARHRRPRLGRRGCSDQVRAEHGEATVRCGPPGVERGGRWQLATCGIGRLCRPHRPLTAEQSGTAAYGSRSGSVPRHEQCRRWRSSRVITTDVAACEQKQPGRRPDYGWWRDGKQPAYHQ